MPIHFPVALVVLLATQLLSSQAQAWTREGAGLAKQVLAASSIQAVPATGTIEVGFSPNRGAEDLVLKVINSASSEIQLMAYSFTSANVTRALLNATKRGVQVSILVDQKNNLSSGSSPNAKTALSALTTAGAHVMTISAFPIHHDKVIIVDGQHVQLGSFNYSAAAATKNSENVLVNWSNPALAKVYRSHFSNNWALGQQFKPDY